MWFLQKLGAYSIGRGLSSFTSTIFALSSGHGKCGVSVIRISGVKASETILEMTNRKDLPKPRMAVLHHIKDPVTHEQLDKGLILWFPGPKSFTGEDSCELQIHGGPAVVASVLSALSKIPNYRPAEAGEFTKRAFHAGKLDLTEVEGLGDLIHAETELQRKQALMQMEGILSRLYNNWKDILLKNVAHVEAYIDFSEEENIEDNIMEVANQQLLKLQKDIQKHLSDGRRGQRLRDGVRTTIIGEPNVGKSSLLNTLCQRPAAIVTPIAGTTRDVIELHININGYPLILTDTAGLRNRTFDIIEQEGISRAHSCIKTSDLIMLVVDASKCSHILAQKSSDVKMEQFIKKHVADLNLMDTISNIDQRKTDDENGLLQPKCIIIFNKVDLLSDNEREKLQQIIDQHSYMKSISCLNEDGFPLLITTITEQLKILCGNPSRESPSLTQTRHRYHLTECYKCIEKYFTLTTNQNIALGAHQLRNSLRHLGKITGHVGSEEILDVIFKDFCIGK